VDPNIVQEKHGGLHTVTFAGGQAHDHENLNTRNFQHKWKHLQWSGGTRIMPGWLKLRNGFMHRFGKHREEHRPIMIVLVLTDGEADDTAEFARELSDDAHGDVFVVLGIVGFGQEHDRAMKSYQALEGNANVRVLPFAGESDAKVIADAMLWMIDDEDTS